MTQEQIDRLKSMLVEVRRNMREAPDDVARMFNEDAEALLAAIAELEAGRWRRLGEEKPPTDIEVLLYRKGFRPTVAKYYDHPSTVYGFAEYWDHDDWNRPMSASEGHYWRPMPSGPEAK